MKISIEMDTDLMSDTKYQDKIRWEMDQMESIISNVGEGLGLETPDGEEGVAEDSFDYGPISQDKYQKTEDDNNNDEDSEDRAVAKSDDDDENDDDDEYVDEDVDEDADEDQDEDDEEPQVKPAKGKKKGKSGEIAVPIPPPPKKRGFWGRSKK